MSTTLCDGCNISGEPEFEQGRVVAVWQHVLWADGDASKCGSNGIDGIFGSNTSANTEEWQDDEGLSSDGIVGPNTWNRADNSLFRVSGTKKYKYRGTESGKVFYMLKVADSNDPGNDKWRIDSVTASQVAWIKTNHTDVSTIPTC